MIDNRTALIIVALLYFILPINAWLALRGQQTRAVAWWCGAGLASGLGAVLIGLRDAIPDMLSFVAGNTVLLAALLMRVHALDQDLGRRCQLRRLVFTLSCFFMLYGFFHAIEHGFLRNLTALAGLAAAAGLVALRAWQTGRRENSANARAIASVFLLLTGALLWRLLHTFLDPEHSTALDGSASATLVTLVGLLTSITGHFSYVGLVLDRSLHSAVESAAERARNEQNRHLGEQLEQLDRLRSLGVMSAALGHELNQPLTAILTNAQVAQRAVRAGRGERTLLGTLFEQIGASTRRAHLIIAGLHSFLHPSAIRPQAIALDRVLGRVLELIEQELRQHGISVSCEARALRVCGDEVQLSQVLLNVMRNAIEAVQCSPRREIRISCTCSAQQARLTIHDSGPGLARELVGRIGTPFFTTKPGGLGMGLSISRAILTQFGGSLNLDNAATGGTWVDIDLPLWQENANTGACHD